VNVLVTLSEKRFYVIICIYIILFDVTKIILVIAQRKKKCFFQRENYFEASSMKVCFNIFAVCFFILRYCYLACI
jgi:hypothetical protein